MKKLYNDLTDLHGYSLNIDFFNTFNRANRTGSSTLERMQPVYTSPVFRCPVDRCYARKNRLVALSLCCSPSPALHPWPLICTAKHFNRHCLRNVLLHGVALLDQSGAATLRWNASSCYHHGSFCFGCLYDNIPLSLLLSRQLYTYPSVPFKRNVCCPAFAGSTNALGWT